MASEYERGNREAALGFRYHRRPDAQKPRFGRDHLGRDYLDDGLYGVHYDPLLKIVEVDETALSYLGLRAYRDEQTLEVVIEETR